MELRRGAGFGSVERLHWRNAVWQSDELNGVAREWRSVQFDGVLEHSLRSKFRLEHFGGDLLRLFGFDVSRGGHSFQHCYLVGFVPWLVALVAGYSTCRSSRIGTRARLGSLKRRHSDHERLCDQHLHVAKR